VDIEQAKPEVPCTVQRIQRQVGTALDARGDEPPIGDRCRAPGFSRVDLLPFTVTPPTMLPARARQCDGATIEKTQRPHRKLDEVLGQRSSLNASVVQAHDDERLAVAGHRGHALVIGCEDRVLWIDRQWWAQIPPRELLARLDPSCANAALRADECEHSPAPARHRLDPFAGVRPQRPQAVAVQVDAHDRLIIAQADKPARDRMERDEAALQIDLRVRDRLAAGAGPDHPELSQRPGSRDHDVVAIARDRELLGRDRLVHDHRLAFAVEAGPQPHGTVQVCADRGPAVVAGSEHRNLGVVRSRRRSRPWRRPTRQRRLHQTRGGGAARARRHLRSRSARHRRCGDRHRRRGG
jgi:hypothetical protein